MFTCGIIETLSLRSCRLIVAVSIPSMVIVPSRYASRNSACITEDLPAPVRPTIPIYNVIQFVYNLIKNLFKIMVLKQQKLV